MWSSKPIHYEHALTHIHKPTALTVTKAITLIAGRLSGCLKSSH